MASFSHILGTIEKQIQEFEARIQDDGLEFCATLFQEAELRVMAAKYAYYVSNNPYLDDMAYDILENSWYIMGRALGAIDEDETSPCIGFDSSNKFAPQAIQLAKKLMKK